MSRNGPERCNFCSAPAAVRMQGLSLCARCGLERSSNSGRSIRRSRRAVLLGLFSSGFLAKVLAGAVALAAVGGVAVTMPREPVGVPTQTSTTTQALVEAETSSGASGTSSPPETETPTADVLVQRAHDYARDMQEWGKCVSAEARDHSGGSFDPVQACGETPTAADHGLGQAPGLAKIKGNQTEDRAADRPAKPEQSNRPDQPDKIDDQVGDFSTADSEGDN